MPVLLAATIILCGCPGCSTNQVSTTYKSEVAIDSSVQLAWQSWQTYVSIANPPMATRIQVASAFNKVKLAEIAAVQATEIASTTTNSVVNATLSASQVQSALTDLSNLLASFNIKL